MKLSTLDIPILHIYIPLVHGADFSEISLLEFYSRVNLLQCVGFEYSETPDKTLQHQVVR